MTTSLKKNPDVTATLVVLMKEMKSLPQAKTSEPSRSRSPPKHRYKDVFERGSRPSSRDKLHLGVGNRFKNSESKYGGTEGQDWAQNALCRISPNTKFQQLYLELATAMQVHEESDRRRNGTGSSSCI